MRRRNLLAVVILAIIPLAVVNAEVTVKLHKPPPGQLKIEHLWSADLTNRDTTTYTVCLYGWVLKEGKEVFHAYSNDFRLPPGLMTIKAKDIKKVRDVWHAPGYKAFVTRTGKIPEGEYVACIKVLKAGTREELGKNCIRVTVRHPGAPRLISPRDGATLPKEEKYPQFTWTPPMPKPANLTYELRIVQILAGQTREQAMAANPAWYEKKGITATNLRYPSSARALEEGAEYAWQVKAFSGKQKIGESEIWGFAYGPKPKKLKLIRPVMDADLDEPYPGFLWTRPPGIPPKERITYTLKMYETDTTSKPVDYTKQKPFYEKSGLKDTSYQYSKKDPGLNKGKAYVWWVEATAGKRVLRPDTAHVFWWWRRYYDFGDALDNRTSATPVPYPTFRIHDGARHYWVKTFWWHHPWFWPWFRIIPRERQAWLGKLPAGYSGTPSGPSCQCAPRSVSWERDARRTGNITNDDDTRDDGVYFFPHHLRTHYCDTCVVCSVDVMASIRSEYEREHPLILHAWFDWNGDGDWDDHDTCVQAGVVVDEHIRWISASRLCPSAGGIDPVFTPGTHQMKFDPAVWGNDTCAVYRLWFWSWPQYPFTIWTRFRLTPDIPANAHPSWNHAHQDSGKVYSGEVEDYLIVCETLPPEPESLDYGDAPDESDAVGFHYCSHKLPGRVSPPPWTNFQAARHLDPLHPADWREWLGRLPPDPLGCSCGPRSVTIEHDANTVDLDLLDDGVDLSRFFVPFDTCDIETVRVMISTSGTRIYTNALHLHAWFDWNRDGDWRDTYLCDSATTPADDHVFWLTAQRLDPATMMPVPPLVFVMSHDFKVTPNAAPLWPATRDCNCYQLTFYAGDTTLPAELNEHVSDSLWCRFRLSYETGTPGDVATEYHNAAAMGFPPFTPSGEVEDYPILWDTTPQPDSCDYGDAPDGSINPIYHYCTHKANPNGIGARHFDPASPTVWHEWLGRLPPDTCYCGLTSVTTEWDANTVDLDPLDDGVDFSRFHVPFGMCHVETVDVMFSTSGNPTRYQPIRGLHLHAWFDWNRDGDWDDTHDCPGHPAPNDGDEHVFWLKAQGLNAARVPNTAWFPVYSHDFSVPPGCHGVLWPAAAFPPPCHCYRLTFYTGDTTLPSGMHDHVSDSMWCRFRLSYDTGTPFDVADVYHNNPAYPNFTPSGEVEDYQVLIPPGPEQCTCGIRKIHMDGRDVEFGSTVTVTASSEPHTIDFSGNCIGPGCTIDEFSWKIVEAHAPDVIEGSGSGPGSDDIFVFDFTFAVPSPPGGYLVTVTIKCSDGTSCSQWFKVVVVP